MIEDATPTILGLDASSVNLGWAILDAGRARDHGEVKLTGADIADRCRQAHAALGLILAAHPDIDCVAIEAPVGRFTKAVIPQARVSGALLAAARLRGLHVVEVSPAAAKKALADNGRADKATMQLAARPYGVRGEHASDALAAALAGAEKVEVVPA